MRLFDGEPMGQPCFDSVEQQFEQAGTQSGQNPYDDGQQRHDLRTGEPFGKLQETDVDTFAPIRDRLRCYAFEHFGYLVCWLCALSLLLVLASLLGDQLLVVEVVDPHGVAHFAERLRGCCPGMLRTFAQNFIDLFDAAFVLLAALADRLQRFVQHGDQELLDLHVAQPPGGSAPSTRRARRNRAGIAENVPGD